MMIIDAHAHIGAYKDWNWSVETLLNAMDAGGVDRAVVSTVSANAREMSGFAYADSVIAACADAPGRLYPLFWIDPLEEFDEARVMEYVPRVRGFKAHPQEARVPFGEGAYSDFLRVCVKTGLSMSVHTQTGEFCDISRIARVCRANPGARVIAVHGELFGDHIRAFELARDIPNLYIETSFIAPDIVEKGAGICGAKKLLFGSDAPVMGEKSYSSIAALKKLPFFGALTLENAAKMFNFEVK